MEIHQQKHLVLILARELASQLATPAFVVDATGEVVFYNEPAEPIAGRSFAEAGSLPAEAWSSMFQVEDLEGNPLPLEELPAGIALLERRPAHETVWMTGLNGGRRLISVTAVPLFASPGELIGVLSVFWREDE